ncbi:PREDICTED: uncharacterized protein At1g15400-like [Camelina sativa]|uniref:Uncharacterized protein At1g15400-like n=1 Tax=Camelina sativa TaxID=90675 RepID=A0ABM0VCW4_CAMSA|nr:PREDICTED: uncharacterized protein At1g15400-like [Camelina sativa]
MALQRSTASFRRQGSSGLIWKDRFVSGEIRPDVERQEELSNDHRDDGSMAASTPPTVQRSASDGGRGHGGARVLGEISPALDPPSPKISSVGCGFCSLFSSNGRRGKQR